MTNPVSNFTVIDSVHGKFVVLRRDQFQASTLIRTGRTHIEDELKVILQIVATLPNQPFFIDAGANAGFVTIPVAQALKPRMGTVVAFEVQRMIHNALCGSVALNDLENVIVFQQGLGAQAEDRMISRLDYGADQDFGAFSLLHQGFDRPEYLKIIPLDSLGLPRLDFLKIDVEGMEIAVLQGAARHLHTHRPWCWIEYWKVPLDELKAIFAPLDYQLLRVDHMNLLCAPANRLKESGLSFDFAEI
jgi:FkbM family methyltransferase